jgi:hypothetical protein
MGAAVQAISHSWRSPPAPCALEPSSGADPKYTPYKGARAAGREGDGRSRAAARQGTALRVHGGIRTRNLQHLKLATLPSWSTRTCGDDHQQVKITAFASAYLLN